MVGADLFEVFPLLELTFLAIADYKLTASSKIIVVTAGVSQKPGDTRLNLLSKNLAIMKTMIPMLAENSPEAILLIVTNPGTADLSSREQFSACVFSFVILYSAIVDVLTYIAWKLSGFPRNRVIGSGTNLDTSRFRFLISRKLGIAPESVHGWIIGEHGDSSG